MLMFPHIPNADCVMVNYRIPLDNGNIPKNPVKVEDNNIQAKKG